MALVFPLFILNKDMLAGLVVDRLKKYFLIHTKALVFYISSLIPFAIVFLLGNYLKIMIVKTSYIKQAIDNLYGSMPAKL